MTFFFGRIFSQTGAAVFRDATRIAWNYGTTFAQSVLKSALEAGRRVGVFFAVASAADE